MLRIKVRLRTIVIEVMTVTIRIITTLGIVTAVVVTRIMRPVGMRGDKDC